MVNNQIHLETFYETFYHEALREFDLQRQVSSLSVGFYPYAGLRHKIRLRSGQVDVRLSDILRDAPEDVHQALAYLLVAKLLRRAAPQMHADRYRDYVNTEQVQRSAGTARGRRGRKFITSPHGRYHNLTLLFDNLNKRYFDNSLDTPTLSWSQRTTRRRLGHYDAVYNTIVISKTLDAARVPKWLVEFVLYHEMLHIKHGIQIVNNRRCVHTREFQLEEQRFPRYAEAQGLLSRIAAKRTRAA